MLSINATVQIRRPLQSRKQRILTRTTHTSEVTAIQGLARVVFQLTLNICMSKSTTVYFLPKKIRMQLKDLFPLEAQAQ